MKTIAKLLIAAAILNAAARGTMAAWTYYQFEDAAQQVVLFGAGSSPNELHGQIVEAGLELGVPVAPENVTVERNDARTRAEAAYVQGVELFPGYTYTARLSFTVDSLAIGPTP